MAVARNGEASAQVGPLALGDPAAVINAATSAGPADDAAEASPVPVATVVSAIDVVRVDVAAMASAGGDGAAGGGSTVRATTLRLPRLRLQQYGAGAGTFVDTSSGTSFARLDAVFLRLANVRRLFTDDDSDDDRRVVCWSDDAAMPSPEVSSPRGANCKTCDYSKWTATDGPKMPPRCGQVVRGVVVVGSPPHLFEIDFGGVSAQPALTFRSAIRHSTLPALYCARVPITIVVRERAGGGRYRAATFGNWATVGEDQARVLEALYAKVSNYALPGRLDEKPLGL